MRACVRACVRVCVCVCVCVCFAPIVTINFFQWYIDIWDWIKFLQYSLGACETTRSITKPRIWISLSRLIFCIKGENVVLPLKILQNIVPVFFPKDQSLQENSGSQGWFYLIRTHTRCQCTIVNAPVKKIYPNIRFPSKQKPRPPTYFKVDISHRLKVEGRIWYWRDKMITPAYEKKKKVKFLRLKCSPCFDAPSGHS